jgi:hypothetical protein
MSTYQKAPQEINDLAAEILRQFETHKDLIAAQVRVDFIFSSGQQDEDHNVTSPAIMHHGMPALGLCSIIPPKGRAMGRGDAEIILDADWWADAMEPEQKALLDHELHHIAVCSNRAGIVKHDDLGRPKLRMRKHDVQIGWFTVIAERHGMHSMERIQAKEIAAEKGQYFWPNIFNKAASTKPLKNLRKKPAEATPELAGKSA